MVELVDHTGGKANLVAVGAIAMGCSTDKGSLGKFALHGLRVWLQRICCAGDTHGRIDIGTARERVTDGSADTGGGAAEGLYFRRMVVGLILEEKEPVLGLAIMLDLHFHRAGVDFL